jgi:membrane fusion protein (multidrug efflux system)
MSVGVLALIIAGTLVTHWWLVGRFFESTDDAFVAADITTISSKAPGFIKTVAVVDNQQVHAGDLLATIDDRDYRAGLAKTSALVAEQQASLANLDAVASLQAAAIDEARAKVASATAETHRANDDADRARSLAKRDVVSAQDFEQSSSTAEKARADTDSARAALVAAQRQLAVIETQRRQTQAVLAQAEAEADLARLNLSYTEIRSPIDGVVGNRTARVGDYATVSAQLMSIVPSSGLYVVANFKESQIAHMQPGQKVDVEADVLKGTVFQGHVDSLAPGTGAQFSLLPAENATGNFTKIVQRVPIRIRLDPDGSTLGKLRPGLSVIASVDLR